MCRGAKRQRGSGAASQLLHSAAARRPHRSRPGRSLRRAGPQRARPARAHHANYARSARRAPHAVACTHARPKVHTQPHIASTTITVITSAAYHCALRNLWGFMRSSCIFNSIDGLCVCQCPLMLLHTKDPDIETCVTPYDLLCCSKANEWF